MTTMTTADFVQLLADLEALERVQLENVRRDLQPRHSEARALAKELLDRNWLTAYQVNKLLQGHSQELLLGPFLLLDRLGEGGMGQVFKAKHRRLQRIQALKVIRKERLGSEDAIRRFYREMRAVAQLQHPNIVRAYDADEIHGVHFFSMEYVPGMDLAKLVKQKGRLPAAQAADFIRQAALGLQHAYERGLIHRDLKPANLLVTGLTEQAASGQETVPALSYGPVVKILDMGLARLETAASDESHTLTREGVVMGTPDFMSPEQSRDSHAVDIRSDLYSLGCTLYYLLTGRVPFPGKSLAEKLLKHQLDPPTPLRQLRPEIPEAVAAVVYRLMAKRPEDRYQTPYELVLALEEVLIELDQTPAAPDTVATTPIIALAEPAPLPTMTWTRYVLSRLPPIIVLNLPERKKQRSWLWLLGGLALLPLVVLLVNWLIPHDNAPPPGPPIIPPGLKGKTSKVKPGVGIAQEEAAFPPGPVTEDWINLVQAQPPEKQVRLILGKLAELNAGFNAQHKDNAWEVRDGDVIMLQFKQPITDISPVRALAKLEKLIAWSDTSGRPAPPVSLADLTPLQGLKLKYLSVKGQRVEDLTPLVGMPIEELQLNFSGVRDLSPLQKLPLRVLGVGDTLVRDVLPLQGLKLFRLNLENTLVTDLTPLRDMPLQDLVIHGCAVTDLTPVRGMPLRNLHLTGTQVRDLSPLTGMKIAHLSADTGSLPSLAPLAQLPELTEVYCQVDPDRDEAVLKSLKKLKRINRQSPHDYWKIVRPGPEHEAFVQKVQELSPAEQVAAVRERLGQLNTFVAAVQFQEKDGKVVELKLEGGVELQLGEHASLTDVTPLAALKHLRALRISNARGYLYNLWPLHGLPLERLEINGVLADDLSPLQGMPLKEFRMTGAPFRLDITPLTGLPLTTLHTDAQISDLTALQNMPLTALYAGNVPPRNLDALAGAKLKHIRLAYVTERHAATLRKLQGLETIDEMSVADFWKEQGQQQVEFVRRELVRLNPGFEKIEKSKFENGVVTELAVYFNNLKDLGPLHTLKDLRWLMVNGGFCQEELVSLEPLRGLPLKYLEFTGASPESFAPLHGMKLDTLYIGYHRLTDLSVLKDVAFRELRIISSSISDLSPLRGLPLESLRLVLTRVKDLSPLRGLRLQKVVLSESPFEDLGPLCDMPLTRFELHRSLLNDLTPLRNVKTLKEVFILGARVPVDLQPLSGLPLESLHLYRTQIPDLTPIQKMPLKSIGLEFEPFRGDADLLRTIPTLKSINYRNGQEFLKAADEQQAQFDAWCKRVAGEKDVDKQVQMVREELKKRNPTLEATTFEATKEAGGIWSLTIQGKGLTDLAPLRALPALKRLDCRSHDLVSLWPLRGLPLHELRLINCKSVVDLSALRGMPLTYLNLHETAVTSLEPLSRSPLTGLDLSATTVLTDLSPVQGLALKALNCEQSRVTDLRPLAGLPLKHLRCARCAIQDFAVVTQLPQLEFMSLDFVPWRDSANLRSLPEKVKVVQVVNDVEKPLLHEEYCVWADWEDAVRKMEPEKQVEAVRAKLKEPNPQFDGILEPVVGKEGVFQLRLETTHVKDISPLRAFSHLTRLTCDGKTGGALTDLAPLRGMALEFLAIGGNPVQDLSPLRGMSLQDLRIAATKVQNLESVRDLPLRNLSCTSTSIADLSPLSGMKTLQSLSISYTAVKDLSPLKFCPLQSLKCNFVPERDAPILRQIPTLQTINGKKKEEVLK